MADEDWLKLDNVNDTNRADPSQHADYNQEVQIDSYEIEVNKIDHGVVGPVSTKRGCFNRRNVLIGLISVVLVVGTAVGVTLAVLPPPSTGAPASSALSNGKNKLGSDSSGHNEAPAPTPAVAGQYGGRPTVSPGPTPSNAFQVADIIDSIARFGGDEFKNTNSYQSLAKKWVLTQNFPALDGSSMTTEQQSTQLYALACIYYATFSVRSEWTDVHYGSDVALPGWYSSRGWLGSAEDVCNWYGLTCNEKGRVVEIQLDTNGLTGSFPPETALLHETLKTIDLYNNMVHNAGDEGNNFLGELTNLEYLFLGTTSFEYEGVPSVLGKLTALKELDVSHNLYFGALDGKTFSKLSNLSYLAMDGNAYNSEIPIELAQLPSLQYLYASFSFLEGGLDFMSSMQNIVELWLDDNPSLKGSIPSSVGNLATLSSFSVANCGLTGTIPSEIGGAASMIQMWLNDNKITGTIPSDMANMVTLKVLNLQNNNLEGDMPQSICDRKRPFGRLEELGADCDEAISCEEQCCTCCGDQCSMP